jgi:1-acyl-sn-glycerol-3-phosphate acyltransferase
MLLNLVGRFLLWLLGWRAVGSPPDLPRYVFIAAPHTSNWDGLLLLAFAGYYRLKVHWLGKKSIFWGPFGWWFRRLGGIPVDRSRANDLVQRLGAQIRAADRFALAIPPEGTRHFTDHWKSGFYHIARAAGVPVALGFLDFAKREGGFGPTIDLTGDVRADMDKVRAFYADKRGKHPDQFSTIRLREEAEAAAATPAPSSEPSTAPQAKVS